MTAADLCTCSNPCRPYLQGQEDSQAGRREKGMNGPPNCIPSGNMHAMRVMDLDV